VFFWGRCRLRISNRLWNRRNNCCDARLARPVQPILRIAVAALPVGDHYDVVYRWSDLFVLIAVRAFFYRHHARQRTEIETRSRANFWALQVEAIGFLASFLPQFGIFRYILETRLQVVSSSERPSCSSTEWVSALERSISKHGFWLTTPHCSLTQCWGYWLSWLPSLPGAMIQLLLYWGVLRGSFLYLAPILPFY